MLPPVRFAQAVTGGDVPGVSAGAGPVDRPAPASTRPDEALPPEKVPPPVPAGVPAGGAPAQLSAEQWTQVRKPGQAPSATADEQVFTNVLLRPGYVLGDTSLLRDALEAGWRDLASSAPWREPLQAILRRLLDELHEDCDFGEYHSQRLQAIIAVAHAVGAVIYRDEPPTLLREVTSSAEAEINIVKGAFYQRTGTYKGATDHTSTVRQTGWQLRDMADLVVDDSASRIESIHKRAIREGILMRSGVMENDWLGSVPDQEEPLLF